jgi:sugar O-acyltransferase (sialic acid O-acetyltransferase NeuD family)
MKEDSGLIIFGAGGHGHVVAETAATVMPNLRIAFLDDDPSIQTTLWPLIGNFSELENKSLKEQFPYAFCGLGSNQLRVKYNSEFESMGYEIPTIIHPTAWVSPSASVHKGSFIGAGVIVNTRAVICDNVILNTSCSIDHDCIINSGVHVAPGAHIAGGVNIKRLSFIGTGASVIPNICIGSTTVIGAGTVVISDVPNGATAVGVPARWQVSTD